MRNYKDFGKTFIGCSDIGCVILVGIAEGVPGLSLKELCFGGDGSYRAYIVDDFTVIGDHYKKVAEFTDWLRIYDDDECTQRFYADKIVIYRAGEQGCIIQLFGAKRRGY